MAEETLYAGGIYWRVFTPAGNESTADADATPRGDNAGTTSLVVLHGLFGSGDNWRRHARALADARTVYVPDMPNHGRSLHVDSAAYPEIAEIVWSALEELGLGYEGTPTAILGHSMGGKVGMAMALSRPEATARLIVADIAPRAYPPRHDEIFRAMEAVASARVESRSAADKLMSAEVPQKAIRMFLLKSLERDDDGVYRWRLNLDCLRRCYHHIGDRPYPSDTAARYDGAVLFVSGGASPYVSTEDYDDARRAFPSARFEVIPGVGHWLHVEAEQRFMEILRSELG